MVRCGAGAGLNIEGCGAVRAPALDDCAVRVRASSLRGGVVAGQTFRPTQGSNPYNPEVCPSTPYTRTPGTTTTVPSPSETEPHDDT